MTQAATRVKNLKKQFKDLIEVAEEVAEIENLEQAKRTAEQVVKKVRFDAEQVIKEHDKVEAELMEAENELDAIYAKTKKVISDTERLSASLLKKDADKGNRIIEDAKKEARELQLKTKNELEKHNELLKKAAIKETEIQNKIDALNDELNILRKKFS